MLSGNEKSARKNEWLHISLKYLYKNTINLPYSENTL